MYVAITRAKRHLHLSYSQMRSNYGQQEHCRRSQFIAEIPPRLVHTHGESKDALYQPPTKKLHVVQQTQVSIQTGFVTGRNLMNVPQWNKKK